MEYTKCQLTAVSLLKHLEHGAHDSILIIRNILDTSQCDVYHDLSLVRAATVSHLNKGDPSRDARISNGKRPTEEDHYATDYVVFEYKEWYIREISKSLSWRNWARYRLTTSPDDLYHGLATAAVVGTCTGLFGFLAGFGIRTSVAASGVMASMTVPPRWFAAKSGNHK